MDHPLIGRDASDLRRRVIHLLRSAYNVRRKGNLVFVCGGNNQNHMRIRFQEYCQTHHPEFEIFLPEYAMKNYFSDSGVEQFDIADFENLIGDLSHVIVLFPEAPGSYAETGYFSAVPQLASKTLLAMDLIWQGQDSFISMGPARKINAASQFYGIIQTPYTSPSFKDIINRINRIEVPRHMKNLKITTFKKLSNYERFCLIHKCYSILTVATMEDLIFILRGLFESQLSVDNIKQLTSVLVGAKYGNYPFNKPLSSRHNILISTPC